jgi:pimeloyl-ACP methyl ester carboxylesterase
VQGLTTDGTAQVVLKIGASPGQNSIALKLTGAGSREEDGYLESWPDHSQNGSMISATVQVNTPLGPMAFAIYHAPTDFARNTSDQTKPSRQISVEVNGGTTYPIQLLRPPVLLIHGIWSGPSTWDQFEAVLNSSSLFNVYRVDYEATSYMSVDFNTRNTVSQLIRFLGQFKSAKAVAAVQFDVIGHSMGGLIARDMVWDPRSSPANPRTFGGGYVHKIITIDTPHDGSELAKRITNSTSACKSIFQLANMPVGGATQDLSPPGSSSSACKGCGVLISKLDTLRLPYIHAIENQVTNDQDAAASFIVASALTATGQNVICYNVFPEASFKGVFKGPSDLLVSADSQQKGFSSGTTATDISPGYMHFHFPLPWLFIWTSPAPGCLDSMSGNPETVTNLLNTSIAGGAFRTQ